MTPRHFRMIETNGVKLRVVVEGHGPLLILLHGFPQCWYLWRNQIDPLVAAGYQVAVPDQRGYGGSECPADQDAYSIVELCKDVVGIADALGHQQFRLVVHDWGAIVGWHTALLHPARVTGLVVMSVPYARFRPGAYTRQENFGDNFFYVAYFQKPGVAEAELDADPRRSMRLILYGLSADSPVNVLMQPKPCTSGFLDGMPEPQMPLAWLSEEDLDYYAAQFRVSGFRGPVSWYRNIDRNLELTPQLEHANVEQPCYFVTGSADPTRPFLSLRHMHERVPNLRAVTIVESAGHWLQMERPEEVNALLRQYLKELG